MQTLPKGKTIISLTLHNHLLLFHLPLICEVSSKVQDEALTVIYSRFHITLGSFAAAKNVPLEYSSGFKHVAVQAALTMEQNSDTNGLQTERPDGLSLKFFSNPATRQRYLKSFKRPGDFQSPAKVIEAFRGRFPNLESLDVLIHCILNTA